MLSTDRTELLSPLSATTQDPIQDAAVHRVFVVSIGKAQISTADHQVLAYLIEKKPVTIPCPSKALVSRVSIELQPRRVPTSDFTHSGLDIVICPILSVDRSSSGMMNRRICNANVIGSTAITTYYTAMIRNTFALPQIRPLGRLLYEAIYIYQQILAHKACLLLLRFHDVRTYFAQLQSYRFSTTTNDSLG